MVSRRRNCSNWKLYLSHNARTNSIIIPLYSTTMQQTTETTVDSEDVNAKSNNSNFSSDCCREGILAWINVNTYLNQMNTEYIYIEYRIHLHIYHHQSASISISIYTTLYQLLFTTLKRNLQFTTAILECFYPNPKSDHRQLSIPSFDRLLY